MNKRKTLARRQFLRESAAILGTSSLLSESGVSWAGGWGAECRPPERVVSSWPGPIDSLARW